MAYTEIKKKDERTYYYRVRTIRKDKKFRKERIYLGKNLSKGELLRRERKADKKLNSQKRLSVINKLIPKIIDILKKNRVKRAGIFGSYIKGKEKKNSDIDILIEPPKGIGFGFVGIQIELEDKLGKKIDLVSYNGLHPLIKKRVLNEEKRII